MRSVNGFTLVELLIVFRGRGDFRSCAERGQNLMESLGAGEYEKATRDLNPILTATLTKDMLAKAWPRAIAECGRFKKYTVTYTGAVSDRDDNQFVCLTCEFEKGRKWMVLVFDKTRRVRILALCDTPNEYQSVINQVRQQDRGGAQPR